MQVFTKMFPDTRPSEKVGAWPYTRFRTAVATTRHSWKGTNILLFVCWLCLCQWWFPIFKFPSSSPELEIQQSPQLQQTTPAVPKKAHKIPVSPLAEDSVEIIAAATETRNTTWLELHLPGWKKNIYNPDDPNSELRIPSKRGQEAMIYLSYIIDRYDTLPGNLIFHRGERFQWHADDPDYDSLKMLERLRVDVLKEKGYVNLRCTWLLGCPSEIRPSMDESSTAPANGIIHAKHVYRKAFQELFPDLTMPSVIGTSCCAQFAVHRDRVWKRPREDYVRYREWLINTELSDELSRRVMEYSWHLMFGKFGVFCPKVETCYCELYGMCGLKCEERSCDGQYQMPPSVALPSGWPMVGWNGEARQWTGPMG